MKITNAAGVTGFLLQVGDGSIVFRVYDADHNFVDYQIHHHDLEVTIAQDYEAAFYYPSDRDPYIDHAPMTLGIRGEYDDTEGE